VTNDAASVSSRTIAAATSSAPPIRPIGTKPVSASRKPGKRANVSSIIGVSIAPGQTAFTRFPRLRP
jgi:hypothetical protein